MRGFKFVILFLLLPSLLLMPGVLRAQDIVLKGRVIDPQGNALSSASVQLLDRNQILAKESSGPDGQFRLKVKSTGQFNIKADAPGFRTIMHSN